VAQNVKYASPAMNLSDSTKMQVVAVLLLLCGTLGILVAMMR
jgi:hypothetical protein